MTDAAKAEETIAEVLQRAQAAAANREPRPEEDAAREAKWRRDHLLAVAKRRNVPPVPSVMDVVLNDEPDETEALRVTLGALRWRQQRCTDYAKQPLVLLLCGAVGRGKTCAACWAMTRRDASGTWLDAAEVEATPYNGWSENQSRWDAWLSVDLLVLDEVMGAAELEKFGAARAEKACTAINRMLSMRYNAGLATVCLGNLSPQDFARLYGTERLADRLTNEQAGAGQPWYALLKGKSLRAGGHA